MQVPQVEAILLGKRLELKLVAREEIEEFFLKKPILQNEKCCYIPGSVDKIAK
jgi:hypothetical protein